MMTTNYTGADVAELVARDINEAERQARRDRTAAGEALTAARDAGYRAQDAAKAAEDAIAARSAELRDLLRAMKHRDEDEAREETPEHGDGVELVATFARCRISTTQSTPGWSAKPKPRKAIAYLHRPGRPAVDAITVYESAKGTSDAAKLEAEYDRALAAARVAIRDYTAAAFLARRDIDPETAGDPGDLLRLISGAKRRYFGGSDWWAPYWYATLKSTGEPIDGLTIDGWGELAELRADRAAGGRYKASHEARDAARAALGAFDENATEADIVTAAKAHAAEALALILWAKL